MAQLVKNLPAVQETPVPFLGQEDPLEKGWATRSSILGLPGSSDSKESACNVGDLGSIPGLGRYPGRGHDNPLQPSCVENPLPWMRGLAGYSPRGCKELHTTEALSTELRQPVRRAPNHTTFLRRLLGAGKSGNGCKAPTVVSGPG